MMGEIKKALEGVTPGPWFEGDKWVFVSPRSGLMNEALENVLRNDEAQANARYIAAVNPVAIAELLSTLESLQRENKEWKRLHDAAQRTVADRNSALNAVAEQIEDFRSETKRLQVGVYVETLPAVHLIHVFADDMNERNWDEKRLYIKQQAERITAALASAGEEHHGN